MDKNKSPQDFLNEIFEKSRTSAPPVPPPRFEPPEDYLPPPAPPAGGPGEKAGRLAKLLPWLLCLALGAVLLLGVCLLQLAQANRRLDELGEEHAALQEERDALERRLTQEQARGTELEQTSGQYWDDYLMQLSWNDHSNLLDCLEQFVGADDYLMAAVMIRDTDVLFNRHHSGWNNKYLTPSQERRYLALREQALTSGTGLRVLQCISWPAIPGEPAGHTGGESWKGDYTEEVAILEGAFSPEELNAAETLCSIFRSYTIDPCHAAQAIAEAFGPDSPAAGRLTGGAFTPSTVERFEQIKAALVEDGLLWEGEDGALAWTRRPDYPSLGVPE